MLPTGRLIWHASYLPRAIGALITVAGAVCLAGSYLLFLASALPEAFQPAYDVCLLAELAFALWFLIRGVDAARRPDTAGDKPF